MEYEDIDEIREDFNIELSDPREIKKILKQKMKKIHPDTNKGEFNSDADKELYHKMNNAIDFFDKKNTNKSIALSEKKLNEIIKSNKDLSLIMKEDKNTKKLNDAIISSKNEIKRQYKTKKYASATIATILSIIWFFPTTISNHPILSMYIDPTEPFFVLFWLCAVYLTIFLWGICSQREKYIDRVNKEIMVETKQNQMFYSFLSNIRNSEIIPNLAERTNRILSGKTRYPFFTKSDLIDFLQSKNNEILFMKTQSTLFRPANPISMETAEALSDIILTRAESYNVIKKSKIKAMEAIYEVIDETSIEGPFDNLFPFKKWTT